VLQEMKICSKVSLEWTKSVCIHLNIIADLTVFEAQNKLAVFDATQTVLR